VGKGWTGRMPLGPCGQFNLRLLSTNERLSGEDKVMDAKRQRRVKSYGRQQWYAHWRQVRFANHMGFVAKIEISGFLFRIVKSAGTD
jgi:hypothetical protein